MPVTPLRAEPRPRRRLPTDPERGVLSGADPGRSPVRPGGRPLPLRDHPPRAHARPWGRGTAPTGPERGVPSNADSQRRPVRPEGCYPQILSAAFSADADPRASPVRTSRRWDRPMTLAREVGVFGSWRVTLARGGFSGADGCDARVRWSFGARCEGARGRWAGTAVLVSAREVGWDRGLMSAQEVSWDRSCDVRAKAGFSGLGW
jgi:hypothetical protein